MHRYFEINESGHNIRCKLYCQDPKAISRIVVFCHGFGGHKDNSAAEKFALRLITKYKKTALVTFNWPSHGDDVKKLICLDDCADYLSLVTRHLQEKYQPEALYCYATSFGGYLTLKYIAEKTNPFRRIALRCPAVNMYDALTASIMSPEEQKALERGKPIPVGFDRKILVSPGFLAELKDHDIQKLDYLDHAEDLLILHGTLDEIVSFEAAQTFADNNLIAFIPVEGADHRFRDPAKMELAMKQILEFFQL